MNDQEFMKALAAFEGPQANAQEFAAADLCSMYKKVKPILEGILPFIKLIPVIGGRAATAIAALMAILNTMCP